MTVSIRSCALAASRRMIVTSFVGSCTMAERAGSRHWPEALITVSPSGKRGVISRARNRFADAEPLADIVPEKELDDRACGLAALTVERLCQAEVRQGGDERHEQ